MPNPRQRVPGPTFTPAPFGLLSVARVVDDPDPHWRNGIEWEPTCAPAARATVGPCDLDGATEVDKTAERGTDGVASGPAVTIFASHLCSAPGRTTEQDRDRAGTLLTNGEGRALERVLFTGETEAGYLPDADFLLANAGLPYSDGPALSVAAGVAVADSNIVGITGGSGVLYMGHALATLGVAAQVLVRNGARLETVLGTPVVVLHNDDALDWSPAVNGGYGELWIYATGPLVVYRQPTPNVYDDLDRSINDRHVIAERTFAFGWDCAAIAVPVAIDVLIPPAVPPN